ncbi:MAG: hypothetical protein FWH46_06995, partial [Methanimicrococcus sp.]|nr:hypothetical protein [Methanimicrococcus sp.]
RFPAIPTTFLPTVISSSRAISFPYFLISNFPSVNAVIQTFFKAQCPLLRMCFKMPLHTSVNTLIVCKYITVG